MRRESGAMEYVKEMITVEKDVLDYLKVIFFGPITDPYEAASTRAYRDFNRTLRFKDGNGDEERKELRQQVTEILRERILLINGEGITTQTSFDSWHKETCSRIRQLYNDKNVKMTFGQAQKWLNMTIKYLYVIGECEFKSTFCFCHIPIDRYVFQSATDFGIPVPETAWSKWDNYDEQYMAYQLKLRSCIKEYDPLRWEFKYWMQEARNHEVESNDS